MRSRTASSRAHRTRRAGGPTSATRAISSSARAAASSCLRQSRARADSPRRSPSRCRPPDRRVASADASSPRSLTRASCGVGDLAFVLAIGLVAGTLSGIVGFGASIMLMPVLVIAYGPLAAVPIMAVASIMANLSRVLVWWREVDWRACAAYSATGIPAAALGARTLLVLPPRVVEIALGAFFIAMIPVRRWLAARELKAQLWHLALAGLFIGFLNGVGGPTRPNRVAAFP